MPVFPRPASLRPALIVAGALAAVAVVIGLAGGWRQADPEPDASVPEVAAGEVVAAGPVDVAVRSWGVVRAKDYLAEGSPIVPTLAVRLTVTTTADASLTFPSRLVGPVTLADPGWLTPVRAGDFSRLASLTPGVTEEVIVTMPVGDPDELDALGDEPLTLAVLGYEWREHALSREVQWWDSGPVASVSVPRDQAFFAAYQDSLKEDA